MSYPSEKQAAALEAAEKGQLHGFVYYPYEYDRHRSHVRKISKEYQLVSLYISGTKRIHGRVAATLLAKKWILMKPRNPGKDWTEADYELTPAGQQALTAYRLWLKDHPPAA